MDHGHTHGHISPISVYLAIFGALMVGTGLTVFAAFIDLGVFNFTVALTIAVVKATLVILFFMHVKYSSRLVQLSVIAAFLWLVLLISGALADYVSRGRVNNAPETRGPTGAALEDR